MIEVAIADDHEIIRSGIQMVIEDDPEIKVVWQSSDGQETIDKIKKHTPDVLVLDIRMPILNGLEVAQKLKETNPKSLKIIMLTMHNDSEYILQSLQFGADGYLLKDTSKTELNKAIKAVNSGQKYFSGDISNTIVNSYLTMNSGQKSTPSSNEKPDYKLTKREQEILDLIYEGVPNKIIAERLNKSVRTVETHRFNIMKKMGVKNITELLKKVEQHKNT